MATRRDHFLYFQSALLVCVNRVIFPVVLAHEFRVRVQTRPVVLRVAQYAFYVFIVLASSPHVHLHPLFSSFLLSNDLFSRLQIEKGEVVQVGDCAVGRSGAHPPRLAQWFGVLMSCRALSLHDWKRLVRTSRHMIGFLNLDCFVFLLRRNRAQILTVRHWT